MTCNLNVAISDLKFLIVYIEDLVTFIRPFSTQHNKKLH